jgi:hypothetical protein
MRPTRPAILAFALTALLAGCGRSRDVPGDANGSGLAAPPHRPANAGRVNRFVNSIENARSEAMRRHYADFSFNFPSHWIISPQPTNGRAVNYVRVADYPVDGYEPFAVHFGYVSGTGRTEIDRRELERQLPQAARELGRTIPNYRITYIGPQQVGRYQSLGWRWEANAPGIDGGRPARIYGRNDMVLPPGATAGISISTVVSDRTGEARSQSDTGETETIRAIFESLRIGPPDAGR